MRGSRLLIGLVVLATVLVDCAVVMSYGRDRDFPHPPVLPWALQASQVSLMAVWLALGRTSGPLRLIGLVGVVAIWAWTLEELLGFPSPEQWNVVLMAHAVAVSAPLFVARWLGVMVVNTSSALQAEGPAATPRRWQFSIAYLLGWMTALAVTLSATQYITQDKFVPFSIALQPVAVVYLLGRGALAWSALGAVLGTRRPVRWGISLGAAAVAGVIGLLAVEPGFAGGFPGLAALTLVEGLLLLGSLAVFRMVGYRLRVGREK